MKIGIITYQCECCGTYRWGLYSLKTVHTTCPICGTAGLKIVKKEIGVENLCNKAHNKCVTKR